MNTEEMANILAEDYSDKVARNGGDYQDAFNHYYERCMKRTDSDLISQIKSGGLGEVKYVISAALM